MKKLVVVVLIFLTGVVFAQQTQTQPSPQKGSKLNLGEIAKKEKERRESLAKEGKKARVYTKDDIERVKSKLGIEPGSTEATGDSDTASQGDNSPAEPDVSIDTAQAAAQQQKEELQAQLDQLMTQRNELQKKVDDQKNKMNAGGPYSVNPTVNMDAINESSGQLQDLNNQIKNLQQQLSELDKGQAQQ